MSQFFGKALGLHNWFILCLFYYYETGVCSNDCLDLELWPPCLSLLSTEIAAHYHSLFRGGYKTKCSCISARDYRTVFLIQGNIIQKYIIIYIITLFYCIIIYISVYVYSGPVSGIHHDDFIRQECLVCFMKILQWPIT